MNKHTPLYRQTTSKKTILILGTGIMQLPVIFQAKLLQHFVIGVDNNPESEGRRHCDVFWHIDLHNIEGIISKIEHDAVRIDAVLTCATDFSYAVACIAEHFHLAGVSRYSAEIANYKDSMRAVLSKHTITIPAYIVYQHTSNNTSPHTSHHIERCMEMIAQHFSATEDIVVKPVDNMGARGVCLIPHTLRRAGGERYEALLMKSLSYSKKQSIIIEQKLEGRELSIDSFMQNGILHPLGIADRHIYFPPYFIETGHSIPSTMSIEDKKAACHILEQAALAAGIENGIVKGDIIFHKGIPYIGEFAARLSGGYMSGWTIPYGSTHYSGMNPSHIAIDIALGREVPINENAEHDECMMMSHTANVMESCICALPGVIEKIIIDESCYDNPYLKNIFMNVDEGDHIVLPEHNAQKIGSIIAMHSLDKSLSLEQSIKKTIHSLLCDIIIQVKKNTLASNFLFASGDTSDDEISLWRSYPFLDIEMRNQAYILNFFNDHNTLEESMEGRPLPIFIPQSIEQHSIHGAWTHCTLYDFIQTLIQKKSVYEVQREEECVGGLFWSAVCRAGWQGFQYLLTMRKEEMIIYV